MSIARFASRRKPQSRCMCAVVRKTVCVVALEMRPAFVYDGADRILYIVQKETREGEQYDEVYVGR
jgi:hypothetical protein